ncbi:MAG: tetratricopeptide (TPR) repeat protein [Bacteriovoracaceae bacterium]|jgi:tetratricopeptide (TPR) repeat protein
MSLENQREVKLLADGRDLFNKNSHKKAYLLFEEVLNINSKSSEAYFYIGNIFHIQGQLGKAVKAFNKVLEIDPDHTDAAISLSVILNDIGRYEDAQRIFEKANEKVKNKNKGVIDPHINKKFAAKHFETAEMYFAYNRYEEALHEYNKAIGLDPENLETRIKLAKVYSKKGYISKAFEELRKLKSEQPAYIPARVALGLLHYGKGNTIEAQGEWQSALSKDPKNEEILMYLNLSKNATETNLNA